MKTIAITVIGLLALALLAHPFTSRADEPKAQPKPYPLDTCLVCDMKLGEMGKPRTFIYQGREIKVCDESEEGDFKKAPDKYLKKLAEAEGKLKK